MNELPLDEISIIEESDPLLDLAKKHFSASFLFPYQRLVICSTLEACGYYGPERAEETNPHRIIILPTGAGKSLCFSLPALIMEKPTLILYPLLGLMADQERRFREAGMGCAVLRGGQGQEEREKIWGALEKGELKVLLSNPETLLTEAVMSKLKGIKPGHLVIDETHTVSEWGDTFRPAYLRLREIILETGVPMVSAYTATASPRILERLKEIIFSGLEPALVSANPDRPNITYRVLPVLSKARTLAGLLGKGPEALERPALVFCRSRAGAELTARDLRKALGSREVFFYHAGLSREEKQSIEAWFFSSRTGILAATCAYGMGVDKPDIRTVVHRDIPPTVEAYLQESGRGGRDKEPARAVLLYSPEDLAQDESLGPEKLPDSVSPMVTYALQTSRCRREYLLSLLGAPSDSCMGCDVCDGEVVEEYDGFGEIFRLIRVSSGASSLSRLVRIAQGRVNYRSMKERLFLESGFGLLSGWREEEIEEALEGLLRGGILKRRKSFLGTRYVLSRKEPRPL